MAQPEEEETTYLTRVSHFPSRITRFQSDSGSCATETHHQHQSQRWWWRYQKPKVRNITRPTTPEMKSFHANEERNSPHLIRRSTSETQFCIGIGFGRIGKHKLRYWLGCIPLWAVSVSTGGQTYFCYFMSYLWVLRYSSPTFNRTI